MGKRKILTFIIMRKNKRHQGEVTPASVLFHNLAVSVETVFLLQNSVIEDVFISSSAWKPVLGFKFPKTLRKKYLLKIISTLHKEITTYILLQYLMDM